MLCVPLPTLGVVHDAVTVTSSVADVVLDVLVAIEFYHLGDRAWSFFVGCIIIFTIANLTYAFLFAATWAKNHTPWGRVFVFLCALPFAQLVPIFVWIESFHFASLDFVLHEVLGLELTEETQAGDAGSRAGVEAEQEGDSLWEYIQSKYNAHAGFLTEALVEAVPQSLLQTTAAIMLGTLNPLNIASIVLSVGGVASKDKIISYSIHTPTC